jgi:radical SAM protein with 4Fe4S-binding SPASM domain
MHPAFFSMVRWAAQRDVTVSTNSNLTLWSDRRADEAADSGLAELHASIDSADQQVYERVRSGAHFGKVVRNLRRLMRACATRQSKLRIRIVAVLMRDTLPGLPALVRFAADEGVKEVFVQQLCHDFEDDALPARYIPMRQFVEGQRIDREPPADRERVFAEAQAVAKARGVTLRVPPLKPSASTPPAPRCDWPWTGAYVSYKGDAMPCCMVGTPDRVNFGNMLEQGVEPVWSNVEFRAFRQGLAADAPHSVCRSCALYRGTF